MNKPTKKDHELLFYLADYKLLSVKQLSAIAQRSPQMIRRRLRILDQEKLISSITPVHGRSVGRPEELIILTSEGRKFLQKKGILPDCASEKNGKKNDSIFIEHDSIASWFRIHLLQIERLCPQFSHQYLTSHSEVFGQEKNNCPFIQERMPQNKRGDKFITFIPDGVFSITNNQAESKKTLLFFLEVDMGTEPLASLDRGSKDVRQKIVNYQALFASEHYKRYENIFAAKLKGFRLLFLANTHARFLGLCKMVRQMSPSDFIWLTEQEKIFSDGVSAKIWARGGRFDKEPESILRQLAFKAPILNKIK